MSPAFSEQAYKQAVKPSHEVAVGQTAGRLLSRTLSKEAVGETAGDAAGYAFDDSVGERRELCRLILEEVICCYENVTKGCAC